MNTAPNNDTINKAMTYNFSTEVNNDLITEIVDTISRIAPKVIPITQIKSEDKQESFGINMTYVQDMVKKLLETHHIYDPFKLAESLDIDVYIEDLRDNKVKGACQREDEVEIIVINSILSEEVQRMALFAILAIRNEIHSQVQAHLYYFFVH
ncbi:hypothetical protein LJC10_05925 [Selenomonadales bacterium OttesenSCG-928-I06]|nr:hypothetical protein [Selenomonadales bacterium OttesenSCG-928-I06]